jgi:hypothetical protein
MVEQDDDPTTSEDRFGKDNAVKSSSSASLSVIAIIVLILGAVFYFSR